ncbi:MAG: 2-oxoglutarate/2-oxoacid ferredoxin oxidoreductase subunit beta, partial [Pseudonocardiales bacterium]|nr:2-oxoglutarate/2-oxoacid ferredoxin oxidoreductase subunit beta [Pseudonocardiales bacterium]
SEVGKITKSTPMGSLDHPFNPVSIALGAEASFVARTLDSDRKHLTSVLRAAADHNGTALVEIYQNCNIFNDGAFDVLKDSETRDDWTIRLEHGQPLRFGADGSKAVVRGADGTFTIAEDVAADDPRVVVHDAHRDDPSYAFALSRISSADSRYAPMGVFRSVERPVYDQMMSDQLDQAAAKAPGDADALQSLLLGADTWSVA